MSIKNAILAGAGTDSGSVRVAAEIMISREKGAEPTQVKWGWCCGSCETTVPSHALSHFCGACGVRINWPKDS